MKAGDGRNLLLSCANLPIDKRICAYENNNMGLKQNEQSIILVVRRSYPEALNTGPILEIQFANRDKENCDKGQHGSDGMQFMLKEK